MMKTGGLIIKGSVALLLITSGAAKLSGLIEGMPEAVGGMWQMRFLGGLQMVIALAWLYDRTAIVGTFLAMAYMGGAMAVHFVKGEPLYFPLVIQCLIWIGAWLRFPELHLRLKREL
ncbi:DoxX family protein [Leadbetterella byssophila]|uniref:DoxX family protein n=1 Tax=Leadbetterella byssophila TaxID=316068 RepID=UPI0039A3904E